MAKLGDDSYDAGNNTIFMKVTIPYQFKNTQADKPTLQTQLFRHKYASCIEVITIEAHEKHCPTSGKLQGEDESLL